MSGTSLDGIDIVIAKIEGVFVDTVVEVIAFETVPYDALIRSKIIDAMDPKKCNPALICSLNFELAQSYSKAVHVVCEKFGISLYDVDYIASHGQTIYHVNEDSEQSVRSSLQLGDGSVLANLCHTTVVSNFRSADIAVGGEGAPLVPYADYILFRDKSVSRALHNIGGISNLTLIPANGMLDDLIAFDTGPGNMMIDYFARELFDLPYDNLGEIAKSGKPNRELLNELMSHPFLSKTPPKSTGREDFGKEYCTFIMNKFKHLDKKDLLCTLTYFTAKSISKAYVDFIFPDHYVDEIILSGGGAKNNFLMQLIQTYLQVTKVLMLSQKGMNESIKEALAFLILGNETLSLRPSNVTSATGAQRPVILGQVSFVVE